MKQLNYIIEILIRMETKLAKIWEKIPSNSTDKASLSAQNLLTRTVAAQNLNVSLSTFDRMKKQGIVTPIRINNTDYYLKENLDEAYQISIKKGKL